MTNNGKVDFDTRLGGGEGCGESGGEGARHDASWRGGLDLHDKGLGLTRTHLPQSPEERG